MDPFYRAFEERHRGSRELIKSRLEVYLPFVEPLKTLYEAPEILDLGCGRGEWLELMQQNGFQAKGVDLDEGMLLACRELKLNVCQADALDYLRGLTANSLSVVSAFHFVEHISFEVLRQLVDEAHRVLKPGGLLILETPNSENLVVGASEFYLDPTHQRPLPAQLLSFVVEYAGFGRVKTLYLQESPELVMAQTTSLLDVLDSVSPDYAIIAQKKAIEDVSALFNEPFERSYGLRLNALAERYDQQTHRHTQWLQHEWDAAKPRIEELCKSTGQLEAELASERTHAQWLQNEWDTARQRIEELFKSTGELEAEVASEQAHAQWLQNEWDTDRQRIEELFKSMGELEAEVASEQAHAQWLQNEWDTDRQRCEELRKATGQLETELYTVNEHNSQLKAHAQWLQNECDTARQRIEELFKSTGELEAEVASEQAHARWLQNEWDTDRQRGEELRKATGQLETELNAANEQIEELNKNKWQLETELNTVNENNSQLQAHAQWLQNELDAVSAKVNELNHELHSIYASKFWRITWPLRKIMQIAKWALALPIRTMRWAIRLTKSIVKPLMRWSMRKTLNNPGRRKRVLKMLAKYPQLKQHLRLFAMNSDLIAGPSMASTTSQSSGSSLDGQNTVSTAYSPDLPETSISNLSPRSAIIYAELKRSIDARKN